MRHLKFGSTSTQTGSYGLIFVSALTLASCKSTEVARERHYGSKSGSGDVLHGTTPDDGGKNDDDGFKTGDGFDDNGKGGVKDAGKGEDDKPAVPGTGPQAPGICRFLNPAVTVTEVIPGSPDVLKIPISDYTKRPELLTRAGATVTFDYTIFQRADGSQKTLFWDAQSKGWWAVNYRAIIVNSDSSSCAISAVATSKPEERTMRGCFAPETKILMADGSRKKIDDIKMNDQVRNPVTGLAGIVVRVSKGPEATKGMIEVGFKDGARVVVTSKHPFVTRGGLKKAQNLTSDDELVTASGQFRKITHLARRAPNEDQRVVNIAVSSAGNEASDHMVEADGIISGDLFLQERLENLERQTLSVAGQ